MSFVTVPIADVSREALAGLVEEFVTRDGTDYGREERSLEDKMATVMAQLERGDVVVVFDVESETFNIVTKDAVRLGSG